MKTFRCNHCPNTFDKPKFVDNNTRGVSPCCGEVFHRTDAEAFNDIPAAEVTVKPSTSDAYKLEVNKLMGSLVKQLDSLKQGIEEQRSIIGVMYNLLWSYKSDLERKIKLVSKADSERVKSTLQSVNKILKRSQKFQ